MRDHPFLGIDPGLLCTSWAIIEGRKCLDSGNIRTPRGNLTDVIEAIENEVVEALYSALDLCPVGNMGLPERPTVAVERYTWQGKERGSNPAGYEIAELAGSIATRAKCEGFTVLRISRNEALRCFANGKRGRKIPSEREANTALEVLLGVRLSNQHQRDAAMAAVAGQRRARTRSLKEKPCQQKVLNS